MMPSWPARAPAYGSVMLRPFADRDVPMVMDLAAGRAAAGYSVAPAHRGRGVGSSALRALTTFAWTIPRLHRIELYIEPWNTASIGVAESAGYQREGLLRSHQQIGGTRRDMLLHAAIRTPSAAEPGEYVSRACGEPATVAHD
jgi:RimJ/RimL family protein N-acetyltransferase